MGKHTIDASEGRRRTRNFLRTLTGSLLIATSYVVQSAAVFVQHQGDVTQGAILAFDSGTGFTLNADLLAGAFHIIADASSTAPLSNNFSGTFRPVEFTNTTGAPVVISPGGIHASVSADFIDHPSVGGQHETHMRTSGNLFVRILGGTGQGDFLSSFSYQTTVFYNPDGSVNHFDAEYLPNATNGASVVTGSGPGIGGGNFLFAMPALLVDPGARLQLNFSISGDASDGSSVNVFNTLGFELPVGVVLTNDVGLPLTWVTNVPLPAAIWLLGPAIAGLPYVRTVAKKEPTT
jgi:hypothetical protein